MSMADYLDVVVPDVSYTLDIKPTDAIIENGFFNQSILLHSGISEQRITWTSTPIFLLKIPWSFMSIASAASVVDCYCSQTKARGIANKFKLLHPVDKINYVVKFNSGISRIIHSGTRIEIGTVNFKVFGKES